MAIYTKTGDKGQTSLANGERISKTDVRIEAYGTVDELNSWIGMLRAAVNASGVPSDSENQLEWIQNKLFNLGAKLLGLLTDALDIDRLGIAAEPSEHGKVIVQHLSATTMNQEDLLLVAIGVEVQRQPTTLMIGRNQALVTAQHAEVTSVARDIGVIDIAVEQFTRRGCNYATKAFCHCYSPCISL